MPSHQARLLEGNYGFFDPTTQAYVVTDLRTPRPWVNVLSNDRMGVVLSQVGGGFSWYENCQLFRISRWEQDLVQDSMGRFVYVQDLDVPDDLWSTTFQPTRRDAEFDQATHGLGWSRFDRRFLSLEVSQTVFVPQNVDAEVWIVRIKNLSDKPRRLRLASYQELHLGTIGDWHREFHRLFMESRVVDDRLVVWKHPNLRENCREELEEPVQVAFGWNGADSVRWLSDKEAWLGRCGTTEFPRGLKEHVEKSETPRWDDPVAVGLADVKLAPGEERVLVHVVSANRDVDVALAAVAQFDSTRALDSVHETSLAWSARCRQNPGITEDPAEDLMVNAWLPYQAIAGRLYARCAYYQQGGAYGFRDQLQDSLMLLELGEPEGTRQQLVRHAEAMYPDGGVRHWWHPDSDVFVQSRHSDTCLWLAFGLLSYLEEVDDSSILDFECVFLPDRRCAEAPVTKGSVLDHALRGIERALERRSPRGLPLIGSGDWNDGLSHAGLDGKGESVWLGMFLYYILRRMAPLLMQRGEVDLAARYSEEADALCFAVNEYGWDGEWYLQGTRDDGRPLGSQSEPEGTIFLNPQTWAVISGIAPPDRVEKAMNSVREQLLTDYGALLLRPAFSHVDPYVGYITRYAPGLRENGGVYSHASAWAIWAFALLGDQETARKVFHRMLPPLRANADIERYAAEPYVMPGNADGPDSPYEARAGWTWYTGSAAWVVRIARRYLLDGVNRK